jgi:O-antigen/teichoic acid export membrane protein
LIIGLPIFGVGQLYVWWAVADQSLVAWWSGDAGMGLYQMVVTAITTMELLPLAVSQVVYPRMAEQYARTGRVEGLLGMTIKPMLLTAMGMVPLTIAAWWLVGPAMRIVVPDYVGAVPAMQWGLLVPFLSSFSPMNNVFNVAKRQGLYLGAILGGMGAYLASLCWLIREEVDVPAFLHALLTGGAGPAAADPARVLTAFPQAMIAGRAVFMVLCYLFVWHLVRGPKSQLA